MDYLTGSLADLAIWKRNLSASEVSQIYTNGMPAMTPNIPPMSIASFTADTPTALQGGSVTLRWNANRFATTLSVDNGVGSVLSHSTAGAGSLTVKNMQKTATYTLTAGRGADQVTAQVTVVVVSGVNPGWIPLDTFDEYTNGPLANAFPYWRASGDPCTIMQMPDGNQVLQIGVRSGRCKLGCRPGASFQSGRQYHDQQTGGDLVLSVLHTGRYRHKRDFRQ